MSGEAGWAIRGELYSVFVGSGRIVSVAMRPDGDGRDVGDYFARANEPFQTWLERAQPRLDALFAQLVVEGIPLVRLDSAVQEIDGVVIEEPDLKADHFRRFSTGLPCPVYLRGAHLMPDGCSLNLRAVVSTRVPKSQLDSMVARVAAILRETESAPAALQADAPPVMRARSSLARRFWSWLRRRP